MSRKLIVPGYTFAGPALKNDEIQTDGSLLLIEPGHPAYPWGAGVPASGSTLTNVLADIAAPYIGDSDATYTDTGLSGSYGLVERTGKGGLYGIASNVNVPAGIGAYITLPTGVIEHMIANPAHHYYYSAWERGTRKGGTVQPKRFLIGAGDGNKMQTYWYNGDKRPSGAPNRNDISSPSYLDTAGPSNPAITVGGWSSTAPASAAEIEYRWTWGNVGVSFSGQDNSAPSVILYRLYIEDLTISGRTHAEVYAIENTLFSEAFGTGGRYYGDTFTDPATIP